MNRIWGALGTAAMLAIAAPAAIGAERCIIEWPADANMKAFAERYFPSAGNAETDALIACLGDPDPAVRDAFAFTLWSDGLRGKQVTPDQMRYAAVRLRDILARTDEPAGFHRPFAALALSEVARADRVEPFLTGAELHELAASGAAYLRGVTDYRGFVAGEGWRHGVAHGADLLMQLAMNPRLSRDDAGLLLAAIAAQVAPRASPFYIHGEPARLTRPLLFLARRGDIDDAAWATWFQSLHPDTDARWQAPYGSDAGLAAVHNSTAFASAIYAASAESQDPQIRRLAPLARAMLRSMP